jgi:hypothetical protein
MSEIKTESISSLNNITGNPNMDLGDDGTTTFNGPVVADRVKAGSSNLLYSFKSRTAATVISVPSWATDIEIDFYAFKATTAAAYYSTITPILKNGISTSDFRLTYETVSTNQSYAANTTASGRWGSASGTTSVSTMYLFTNSASIQYTYSGTIRFKKVLFENTTNGSTNNVYYTTMNAIYSGGGGGGNGVVRYSGLFYGAGNDPTDVITEVQFGTNSFNDTHNGSFVARFREEDPGTLVD